MGFGGVFVRHKMFPGLAATAILGGAAVIALPYAMSDDSRTVDTDLRASVTECHDMVTISVAGRGDTPVEGTTKMLVDPNGNALPAALSDDYSSRWVDPVVNAPKDDVDPGSYAAVYIAYPANMDTYEEAVDAGVANSEQVIREIRQACPDTRFSIVGYSEGADVVRRVAMNIGHQDGENGYAIVDPDNVVGVVILADAGRSAGDGPFPGAEDPYSNPDNFDRKYQNGSNPVSGEGALPGTSGDFGSLNGKVASFCSDGDLTCSAPQNISLLQLAVNVGRQLNVDALERDKLTPATGQDVAVVLGDIAMKAFADIESQPNWWQSDETFLEVLLRVSDPAYVPGATTPAPAADAIATEQMSPLAYLPQKIFNEIIGLVATNENTIPVILSDPYAVTFGQDYSGHHFDYWRDADPANGRPLTSSEYAAAWLTHLAQQAQNGEPVDPTAKPDAVALAAALKTVEATTAASTTTATSTSEQASTSTAVQQESVTTTTPEPGPTTEAAAQTEPPATETTTEAAPTQEPTTAESSTTQSTTTTSAPAATE